ncbi:hypothetical protein LIER_34599 [Lithospermum erythrorhizon]|uniref:Pectinesterase inhibitor domain-containing protein n=1 Tax=Lithospermum erythrorhizon TaxID=34254 RepID=A0AAV3RZY8_LITER
MGPSLFLFLSILTISSAHGDTDLISKTCKSTKYYDLCVSSLKANSTSFKEDPKGLAMIMVRVAMTNATSTNSYLFSQATSSTNNVTSMKKILKECANKYGFAKEALQSSLQDLADEVYDYAYMHVMAAADYPNSCHNAFKRFHGLAYPSELARREEGFKHICDVVLGIIDTLGF